MNENESAIVNENETPMDLLTDPDSFFRRQTGESSMTWSFAMVLLSAVLGTAGPMYILWRASLLFPENPVLATQNLFSFLGSVVGIVVLWVVYAGLFQIISTVFGGSGEFRETLKVVGWGYLPRVVLGFMSLGVALSVTSGVTFPSGLEERAQVAATLLADPAFSTVGLLGFVFIVWQGFLWVFAVKHARNLDTRSAAMTVAGPLVLTLLVYGWMSGFLPV